MTFYLFDHIQQWVIPVIALIIIFVIMACSYQPHFYKMIDGKLFVKHGKHGKWLDLEEHMKYEHKDDDDHAPD